ncbi:hypothetical protein AE929_09525 [Xanthomonas arboricola]|uniref:DUF4224 domain-containing protein n=1 Tax=Xanthomonas campestris pv. juglandis TaxID=195709 RepID=A0A7U7DDM8_XANCJ|nr:DUF4224 domain-containing protein [Xanthomonas arboricola]KOA98617.1 hypothetical protein AE920_15050 [Xanthomonas arboricola]KOB16866.1 hypothetical protein AE924_06905 [Xanthomonas arboricola]KOB25217.1 hypothetical protein AE927_15995 [Xanthomonas arboricola]KOB35681.1 hypothetical protein AE929_09525 [Xanthomonas arboricola]KOB45375.1 hypothetical protein AE931_05225 [Xanthomonas arboricola]
MPEQKNGIRLSRYEVKGLTGTPYIDRQLLFLVSNGIRHYVDLNGRPVVLRSTIEGAPAADAGTEAVAWKPNKAA